MIYTKLLPIYRLVFLFCITPFMLAKLPFGSKACGLNSCRSFCSQPSVNIRVVILVFVVYIPSGHWFIRVLKRKKNRVRRKLKMQTLYTMYKYNYYVVYYVQVVFPHSV